MELDEEICRIKTEKEVWKLMIKMNKKKGGQGIRLAWFNGGGGVF